MSQKRDGFSSPSPLSSPTKIQKNSVGSTSSSHSFVPVSPSKKNQSHQKVTIVLTTPPRSVHRNTMPISSSPKRVRFSIPGEPEPVSPIRKVVDDSDVARITLDSDYQSPMKRNTLRRYVHFKQVLHGNVQQKVSLPSEPNSSFQIPVLPKPVPYYKLVEQQSPEKISGMKQETITSLDRENDVEEDIPKPQFVLEEGLSVENHKPVLEIEFSDEEEDGENDDKCSRNEKTSENCASVETETDETETEKTIKQTETEETETSEETKTEETEIEESSEKTIKQTETYETETSEETETEETETSEETKTYETEIEESSEKTIKQTETYETETSEETLNEINTEESSGKTIKQAETDETETSFINRLFSFFKRLYPPFSYSVF